MSHWLHPTCWPSDCFLTQSQDLQLILHLYNLVWEPLIPYLGHLVDVKELGKLDAEHFRGESDGTPPSLTNLNEPGSPPTTAD